MKCLNLFLLLAVLFLSNYALAQIPPCPCDTETLSNGLTGNDIVEIVCPGGNLGDDSSSIVEPDLVAVFLESVPFTTYIAKENNVGDKFCEINTDGVLPVTLQITDGEYLLCRERLIAGCGLVQDIPTLSEWGLIAMAGVLGMIGLLAIRRRKVTV